MAGRTQAAPRRERLTDDATARAFLLERFTDFLALERGSASRTQEAYGRDVARFATFARVRGAASPNAVTAGCCVSSSTT